MEWLEAKEGIPFKRGVEYEVANGVKIPNEGEKHLMVLQTKVYSRA